MLLLKEPVVAPLNAPFIVKVDAAHGTVVKFEFPACHMVFPPSVA